MSVIKTLTERCKRCYTCIRECPAKAIRVERGQAQVMDERCLGCGHCVRVCSQKAKAVLSGVDNTLAFLTGDQPVIAMLAPSFSADFPNLSAEKVVGALRQTGFTRVVEVAFGADLINREYYRLANEKNTGAGKLKEPIIISTCPVICSYIEKFMPELLPNLAPVVSPMIAMGRVVRKYYGTDVKVVFIGPCAAKKNEMMSHEVLDAVDEVLTFKEIREIWRLKKIVPDQSEPAPFDPPQAFMGRLYPISGGLLRSAGLPHDLMNNEVIVTEGKQRVLKLLESLKDEEIKAKFIDVLFCEGCINGPFMDFSVNYFTRKQRIVSYTESLRMRTDYGDWKKSIMACQDVPITRAFKSDEVKLLTPSEQDIDAILRRINKYSAEDELNCGACGYETCREYASAVFQGIADEEMCLPRLIDELQETQSELQQSLKELAETQEQLVHREKLASIGQLAAGVAHEVNNPLGSIMLYAHLLLQQNNDDQNSRDLKFIIEEARRCQKIVAGLLNFARQGQLKTRSNNLRELIDKLVNVLARQPQFENVMMIVELDEDLPDFLMDSEQIYQVFLNIGINAGEAMPNGGQLTIKGYQDVGKNMILISFIDTGVGIPPENLNKLFTPFFTTKQIGQGTGLGLAIAYGIVKMHKGNILVKSQVGKGTTFTIELPLRTAEYDPIPLPNLVGVSQ